MMNEEDSLRSAALQNAQAILAARQRAEEALREERRLLELLNRTGAAIASQLDLRELVQTVTDAATELSGARFGAFFYNLAKQGEPLALYALSGVPRGTAVFEAASSGQLGMPSDHAPMRSYLAVPVVSRSGEPIGNVFLGHPEPGVFSERDERLVVGMAAQAAVAIDNARLYEAAQKSAEERKQLLDSERAARAEAERMSDLKDDFLATLSHELRTPLSAILGWSQVLRRRKVSEAELQHAIDIIERNARAQTQLIEDLLDMSRITSGKLRLEIQPVEPATFIDAALETVRPAAHAKGIRLEKILDPAAGPISGDPGRLQQVVWNLLANAIKFTPRAGKVQVLLQRVNSHIEISVADTGSGIRADFLEHMFERFRQADASTTRKHGGLGLGLSIVRQLVELHGGTVRAQSAGEGRGATFTVHLPLAVVQAPASPEVRLHPRGARDAPADYRISDLTGIKVLVVDDEPDARGLLGRVLGDCGAEVWSAGSAQEALALLALRRPDVLLSDVGMPDMDGFELLRRVRELEDGSARLPAIALTAFARSEDRTRALRAGFLVHVSKPVEPAELVATVASVAGRVGT